MRLLIALPNSITTLGDCAFINCVGLKSIVLSNNLTKLNEAVFMGCESLTSISLPEKITTIESQALRGSGLKSISFPYLLTTLGEGAFKDCTNLESIDFSYSVENIGKEAFLGCVALKTISLPSTVISVGESAFEDCTALTDVNFSYGIEKVSDYMFYNCNSLQNVNIINNITEIGAYAFYGSGLTDLIISDNVSIIGENAFENSLLASISVSPHNDFFTAKDGVLYNKALTSIVYVPNKIIGNIAMPQTVTEIGGAAFQDRSLLNSITIPGEITNIGALAFSGCINLTIYVESYTSTPSGWNSSWNSSNRPVVWRCTLDSNGYVASIYKTSNSISNPTASGGIKAPYLDGFEFVGWATMQNGAVTYLASEINNASNNITLYAVWEDLFVGNFEFISIDSGNSYEVKVKDGSILTGDVVIPSSYRGLPVTKIAENGFSDNVYANAYARTNEITKITLPDSIKEIGKYAFSNCKAVTIVNISPYSSLKIIGDQAFGSCWELQSFYLPKEVTSLGRLSFYSCSKLENFTFAEGSKLAAIGDNSFSACSMICETGSYLFECGNQNRR